MLVLLLIHQTSGTQLTSLMFIFLLCYNQFFGQCLNCGEEGHKARSCPVASNTEKKPGCFKCDSTEHIAKNCPVAHACHECGSMDHKVFDIPSFNHCSKLPIRQNDAQFRVFFIILWYFNIIMWYFNIILRYFNIILWYFNIILWCFNIILWHFNIIL